jgi:hypothetical protein
MRGQTGVVRGRVPIFHFLSSIMRSGHGSWLGVSHERQSMVFSYLVSDDTIAARSMR